MHSLIGSELSRLREHEILERERRVRARPVPSTRRPAPPLPIDRS